MKIVCTSSVTCAKLLFPTLGDVIYVDDEKLCADHLRACDVLITRSQTKITPALLKNSSLKFMGTATSGSDHVAKDYLQAQGTVFADAKGSNAESVSEYVLEAILLWLLKIKRDLTDCNLGIIGYGHVGKKVAAKASALGIKLLINDPPLHATEMIADHVSLAELLIEADIVTLHIPLEKSGLYPTVQLANKNFFENMSVGKRLFINTSRGEVVDYEALLKMSNVEAVLDVWPNEPHIDPRYIQQAWIATPHIAGHALLAKARGTFLIYEALCHFLNRTIEISWDAVRKQFLQVEINLPVLKYQADWLSAIMAQIYNIKNDAEVLQDSKEDIAETFRRFRQQYQYRLEFSQGIINSKALTSAESFMLGALGFTLR